MKKKKALLFFILPLFFCSCSGISGGLAIMEANFKYSRRMYNEAVVSYMKALGNKEIIPYAEYGLGTAYFAMGEEKEALDHLSRAIQTLEALPQSTNRELHYRIHYNTGVVLFSRDDFSGAANSFRDALRVDGRKIEAKRNLELCIQLLARENLNIDKQEDEQENESMIVLFELIRQKELNEWKSREWTEEENITGPDY